MSDFANWNLDSLFPGLDSAQYAAHLDSIQTGLAELDALANRLGPFGPATSQDWVKTLLLHERLMAELSHLRSYVGCLVADNARDEARKAAMAKASLFTSGLAKAFAPVMGLFRSMDDAALAALALNPELAEAGHFLAHLRTRAAMTMDPDKEALVADLRVDGPAAWSRLYDEMNARLEFEMPAPEPGAPALKIPMAQKRALLEDPDPATRRLALCNSNQAWESVEYAAAACLNALAGTRLTLYRYRKIDHFLTPALFEAKVRPETLDAMWSAVAARREVPWRYLHVKAKLLGLPRLGFQDISCPLPLPGTARLSWDQAQDMVLNAFASGYPALADFSRGMFQDRRIESEKRPGKSPGAFCSTSLLNRESRVFMTFGGGIGDAQTLAHELGHAFHARLLRDKRPMAALYPMTLAETASTFAERLVQDALLRDPSLDPAGKLRILTNRMNDAAVYLCDIHMRFLFEQDFYAERAKGEVPLSRIKELMLKAQGACFGDALDMEQADPMFWASKLHFYLDSVSFYNFPYTFGYCFSLSLAAQAARQGPAFFPRYKALLGLTGSATAEEAASQALGIDLGAEAFWDGALDLVTQDLADFEALAATL